MIAEDRCGPIGYAAGILRPEAHRVHVLSQHRWPLIVKAAISLARRPTLLSYFLRTRSRVYARKLLRHERRPAAPNPSDGKPAVLAHVAVAPSRQCQGVGRRLVLALTTAAQEAGCTRIMLVTEQGAASESFYRHLQWVSIGTHQTTDGKAVTTFHKDITVGPGAETKGIAGGN